MKNSKNVNIAVFFIFLLFFTGFFIYKPYLYHVQVLNGFFERLFYLYFFVINQTLGIVHEAGHGVCYLLPCTKFFMVLNGTLFQWAFPFGVGLYYLKKGNKLAFYISLFFLGLSMQYTAWYISTSNKGPFLKARESFLGVDSYHDFYYLLSYFNILDFSGFVSGLVKFVATILMLICIIWFFLNAFLTSPKKD